MKKFLLSVLLCFSFLSFPVHAETTESNPYNKSQTARQYKNNFKESPFYQKILNERKNFYSAGTGGSKDNKAMKVFLDFVDTMAKFSIVAKGFAFLGGLALLIKTLSDMRLFASDGRPPKYSFWVSIILIIVSICLMNVPQAINAFSGSLFDGEVCASKDYVSCSHMVTENKGELYNASKNIMAEEFVDSFAFNFFKGIVFLTQVFGFVMFMYQLFVAYQMGANTYKGSFGPFGLIGAMIACGLLVDTEYILIHLFNYAGSL